MGNPNEADMACARLILKPLAHASAKFHALSKSDGFIPGDVGESCRESEAEIDYFLKTITGLLVELSIDGALARSFIWQAMLEGKDPLHELQAAGAESLAPDWETFKRRLGL